MKKISTYILSVLLLFIISASGIFAQSGDELEWKSIEEVQKEVVDNPKLVFIDFTAKWCGWCKVMDKKTFTSPEVIEYLNENFYSVKLNFDNPRRFEFMGEQYTAKDFAKSHGITGLPTMLVFNPDMKLNDRIVGYQKPKQFINKLKPFLE
ncbi:MAG: thioredoxin fold domain-containing protein [Cyclobacteriaceae bacterium]